MEYNLNGATVHTGGALTQSATDSAQINATVASGAAAASAPARSGSLGGAGTSATNEIAIDTTALIQGGLLGPRSLDLETATDSSSITVLAGAAAIAAGFGGVGVAVSVSVGLATNTISNQVLSGASTDRARW